MFCLLLGIAGSRLKAGMTSAIILAFRPIHRHLRYSTVIHATRLSFRYPTVIPAKAGIHHTRSATERLTTP